MKIAPWLHPKLREVRERFAFRKASAIKCNKNSCNTNTKSRACVRCSDFLLILHWMVLLLALLIPFLFCKTGYFISQCLLCCHAVKIDIWMCSTCSNITKCAIKCTTKENCSSFTTFCHGSRLLVKCPWHCFCNGVGH